jgi:hypothetical protein
MRPCLGILVTTWVGRMVGRRMNGGQVGVGALMGETETGRVKCAMVS